MLSMIKENICFQFLFLCLLPVCPIVRHCFSIGNSFCPKGFPSHHHSPPPNGNSLVQLPSSHLSISFSYPLSLATPQISCLSPISLSVPAALPHTPPKRGSLLTLPTTHSATWLMSLPQQRDHQVHAQACQTSVFVLPPFFLQPMVPILRFNFTLLKTIMPPILSTINLSIRLFPLISFQFLPHVLLPTELPTLPNLR